MEGGVMIAYTDYPFLELGDKEYDRNAPISAVELICYDGDKYVGVKFEGKLLHESVKTGYLYTIWGRYGEVPVVPHEHLPHYNITEDDNVN